jgi:hypothetical protein
MQRGEPNLNAALKSRAFAPRTAAEARLGRAEVVVAKRLRLSDSRSDSFWGQVGEDVLNLKLSAL